MTNNIVALPNYTQNVDPWEIEVENQELPPGFSMDAEAGTWYTEASDDPKKPPRITHVSNAIVIVARVRDDNSKGWGRIFKFKDDEDKFQMCFIPDTQLHDTAPSLTKELAYNGFHVETGKYPCMHLKNLLNKLKADINVYAKQAGWQKDINGREVFVMPSGETIGGRGVLLRPDCVQKLCAPCGSLQKWQEQVAAYAVGNSRMILSMCVPFAATLLNDTNISSGGFHFFGPSQIAKTTVVKCAASVQGKPDPVPDGVMASWNNTANALEGVTARANDCGLFMDEMSQAQPNDVAKIIYAIGNGAGKGRMRADSSMRDVYKWRTMVLSTGEERAEDKLAQIGKKANAGVDVRLANVPADAGKGHGVFDTLHGFKTARDLAKMLNDTNQRYYGHGLREFVKQYTTMRNKSVSEALSLINGMCEEFIQTYVPADASHQVKSVANRFALAATAGEMAILFGILPWPEGEANRGVAACMTAWIEERGNLGMAEDKRILIELKSFLLGHQFSHFTDSLMTPEKNFNAEIYGIRRSVENGDHYDFFIFQDHMSKIVPGVNPKTVAKIAYQNGFLIRENGRETNTWRFRERAGEKGITPTYRISGRIFEYGTE